MPFAIAILNWAQVGKAFDYLQQSAEVDMPDVRYTALVKRSDSSASGRGIYLREPADTSSRLTFTVKLEPRFHEVARFVTHLALQKTAVPTFSANLAR